MSVTIINPPPPPPTVVRLEISVTAARVLATILGAVSMNPKSADMGFMRLANELGEALHNLGAATLRQDELLLVPYTQKAQEAVYEHGTLNLLDFYIVPPAGALIKDDLA